MYLVVLCAMLAVLQPQEASGGTAEFFDTSVVDTSAINEETTLSGLLFALQALGDGFGAEYLLFNLGATGIKSDSTKFMRQLSEWILENMEGFEDGTKKMSVHFAAVFELCMHVAYWNSTIPPTATVADMAQQLQMEIESFLFVRSLPGLASYINLMGISNLIQLQGDSSKDMSFRQSIVHVYYKALNSSDTEDILAAVKIFGAIFAEQAAALPIPFLAAQQTAAIESRIHSQAEALLNALSHIPIAMSSPPLSPADVCSFEALARLDEALGFVIMKTLFQIGKMVVEDVNRTDVVTTHTPFEPPPRQTSVVYTHPDAQSQSSAMTSIVAAFATIVFVALWRVGELDQNKYGRVDLAVSDDDESETVDREDL